MISHKWRAAIGTGALCLWFAGSLHAQNIEDVLNQYCRAQNTMPGRHGGWGEALRALARPRFDASRAIRARLEATTLDDGCRSRLFRALGAIKDPADIPLIRRALDSERARVFDDWLPQWTEPSLIGLGSKLHQADQWIETKEEWCLLFRDLVWTGNAAQRKRALLALASRFYDSETTRFIQLLSTDAMLEPEEVLITQTFLAQQGVPIDGDVLTDAISDLDESDEGRACWLAYSSELRHEVFVPALLRHAPCSESVRDILCLIACCDDRDGRRNWNAWFEQHPNESHEKWVVDGVGRAEREIGSNGDFDRYVQHNRWLADRAALPSLKKWSNDSSRANGVVFLLASMYYPAIRPEVAEIARKVAAHHEALSKTSKGLLRDLGFFGKPTTWPEWVSRR